MPATGTIWILVDRGHERLWLLGVFNTQAGAQAAYATYMADQAALRYANPDAANRSDADQDSVKWVSVPANTLITNLSLKFKGDG